MTQIRIMALRHSAFYSPLLMTMAGGFLKDEGLVHTYAVATPARGVAASLKDGSCHVAQSAVATSFAELEKGIQPDIVHFAQINQRDGFFLAGRRAEPNFRWSQLVDRTVLVDHFFQPMAMFKYALHRQGVDIARVKVVDAGDVDAIDRAFRRGQGDYVHQQGPAPQQLERDGLGHVVAAVGDAIGPVAFSSLCARRDWLDSDMAVAFARAYRRARAFTVAAPAQEIAARAAEADLFPGIDRKVLADTVAAYQRLGCWEGDIAISRAAYEQLLEVFSHSAGITRRHDYDAAIVPPPR